MQIKTSRQKIFTPMEIILRVESQDEFDRLGSLFNYSDITDFLGDDSGTLGDTLKAAGADIHKYIDVLKLKLRE